MPTLQTLVENRSRFSIDLVWENALDLEHVSYLHGKTNKSFTLLHWERSATSSEVYDSMTYRCVRRFHFLGLEAFGFRKVIRRHQLHQVEYLPVLGITSALNSMLLETGDAEFPTLMRDEVVWQVPRALSWLAPWLKRAVQRHAAIQCAEDEPFRERRALLKARGITLPYRVFNQSTYEMLTAAFEHSLEDKLKGWHGTTGSQSNERGRSPAFPQTI